MAKIKVTSKCEIYDGMSITFQAPCDCTAVDGLTVSDTKGNQQTFTFRDALNNDLAGVDNVFVEGTYLTAVLNTRLGVAYLQNPATNAHLEYQSFTKDETLLDLTKSLYGLNASATPNDIFMSLKMPAGYYGFSVTAKFSDGSIASNLELRGLLAFDGSIAVTDQDGFCFAMSTEINPTVDFGDYIGIVDAPVTVQATLGQVYTQVEIVVEKDTGLHLYTTSTEVRTYQGAIIDVCAVGGGGGGAGYNGANSTPGGGGGGGYAQNKFDLPGGTPLVLSIGSGGKPGGGANDSVQTSGGTTTISQNGSTVASAAGGMYGKQHYRASGYTYGVGNGNGGYAGRYSGVAGSVHVFNDTSLPLPGGGGGYGSGAGGADFGGAGGSGGAAQAGRGPGGGGGGVASASDHMSGAYGAAGGAYLRARFE